MTLNEWLLTDPAHPCDVPTCEYPGKPYPVGPYAMRLCGGHGRECDHRGREAFEVRYAVDLGQLASAYAEAYRQWYFAEQERLKAEIRAARDAQADIADKYLA